LANADLSFFGSHSKTAARPICTLPLLSKNPFHQPGNTAHGSSVEHALRTPQSAGSDHLADLHSLDVRGLQPFGAGFHFKADAGAFL
jgi:hypothetical protein